MLNYVLLILIFYCSAKIEESKELRKIRKRVAGVSAEGLLAGNNKHKASAKDVSIPLVFFLC